ncbi:TonB-dependent receptor [Sphingomonas xinjiangensis]|uniref:TonB-dependent receptor n=1 Tax=Sphingomonas xinjiangensis TaxID=643568 RepID=A0A840YKV7_9SPHN|nr:TonB-dependent receptor [Sphingomonas xinjiangensis]MBB5709750.1 TonB-dependent receptor [Sphingomonas xinjiangensis]
MHPSLKVCLLLGGAFATVPAAAQQETAAAPGSAQTSTLPSAQDTASPGAELSQGEAQTDDVVITGIRSSLAASARIKRDAQQIVDTISAEDVGKFPDANIAESLQRITGVAIDRSGGEGQFITVRGLGPEFNTVLVNGRVMATDNPGREFSFDVLSSNMIQRTDVFKSSVPELQEGGIGATVNIITARPLDGQKGFHFAASAGAIYDRLREKTGPDASATASWTNDSKTFGVVLSGSYTDRYSQLDFVQTEGWLFGPQQVVAGTPGSTNLPASAVTSSGPIHTPQNIQFDRFQERRKRINVAGAVQAQLTDTLLLTVDGIFSKFDVVTDRNYFVSFYAQPFIGLQTDENGTVTSFNRFGLDFLAANPAIQGAGYPAGVGDNITGPTSRLTETYQAGGNLKWSPSADVELRLDVSRTQAVQRNPGQFVVVGARTSTAPGFDLNKGNDLPIASNLGDITNPAIMTAHYLDVSDNRARDEGSEYHLDSDFKVHDSILQAVRVGFAYSDRQKVRRSLNNQDGQCAYCGYEIPIDPALLQPYKLDNFLSGATGAEAVPKQFFTYDPNAIIAYLSDPARLALPRSGRTAEQQAAEAARLLALPGGPFGVRENLGSRLDVTERLLAGYIAMQFGGERWTANGGVRVVRTETISRGFDLPVLGISVTPGDDTLQFAFGTSTPVSVRNSYVNALPSFNIKYNLTDKFVARAAFSQTVTRPTLTDLGVDNNFGGRVSVPLSGGGNPSLQPFKSTNYDVSLEWYLSSVSYLSVGGFYKTLNDFLELQTLPVQRFGRTFQDTRTRNGQTGYIRGVEVGGQYAFDWLPGFASGFGVTGNYTYVNSKAERDQALADYECGYNGLSPHSANGSVFYEKFGISARASYNWRSEYLRACQSSQGRPRNRSSYGQLDFNLGYDVTPNLQLYVQGVNVTNQRVHEWSAIQDRFLLLQDTGARYNFGVRANF